MAKAAKVFLVAALATTPALLCAIDGVAPGPESIPRFSDRTAGAVVTPGDWSFQPVRTAKNLTTYTYVRDEEANAIVLEGIADNAGGALIHRFDGSAKSTPVLRFQWKVGNVIARSDPTTKAGDDYAARIYITFAYDPARATMREKAENSVAHMLYGETPPHAALSYVFTHKVSRDSIITSPYTHRVKKLVVDDDPGSVGKWRQFERNIYDDYRRAFNEEPTRISGIALMVDTDNTGERARSRFGDITLRAR